MTTNIDLPADRIHAYNESILVRCATEGSHLNTKPFIHREETRRRDCLAVMQNQTMAASLGFSTHKHNGITFHFR